MKFVIINTDYPDFIGWLYAQHPELERESYDRQMQVRAESLFGVADFYSSNLRKLGHEVCDLHVNNEWLQRQWAKEHGIHGGASVFSGRSVRATLQRVRRWIGRTPLRFLKPVVRSVLGSSHEKQSWFNEILAAQIRHHKPDVILNQAMDGVCSQFLREMKSHARFLVGQIASPLPRNEDFRVYDLIISSLPNYVEYFCRMGVRAELHRFAFEPRIINRLKNQRNKIEVSFAGSLSSHHKERIHLLEYLCGQLDMEVWGQGMDGLTENSPVRRQHKGVAWGIEMYQILHQSKVTLNHHIGIAESWANNMRLFEATGVGTLLITDWKTNLEEMFKIDREVVAYRTPQECAEKIRYYLQREDERQSIAKAGQKRTLEEHTYDRRMEELVDLVHRYFL